MDEKELAELIQHIQQHPLKFVCVKGMMGMASFVDDEKILEKEFSTLNHHFQQYKSRSIPNSEMIILSMGMSGDYPIAIKHGSNLVRIGSLLFGRRNY
jgi:uncharacterized pyridoxal phosphate-containing UPF0001 family protein